MADHVILLCCGQQREEVKCNAAVSRFRSIAELVCYQAALPALSTSLHASLYFEIPEESTVPPDGSPVAEPACKGKWTTVHKYLSAGAPPSAAAWGCKTTQHRWKPASPWHLRKTRLRSFFSLNRKMRFVITTAVWAWVGMGRVLLRPHTTRSERGVHAFTIQRWLEC